MDFFRLHINYKTTSFQQKIKPYLITKTLVPENQETPIHFVTEDLVTDNLFYRRNHFPYPAFSSSFYFLPIEGHVKAPTVFSLEQIYAMPSNTIKVVLECSGDKRELFKPKVFGEGMGKGAISQGIWKGVPLRTLLQYVGLLDHAKEVVFEGYNNGQRFDSNKLYNFTRSLPIEKALDEDTIIAYEYNNHPLSFKHGFPLRLIVPGWYGMASVKWRKKIVVINKEFKGPFQTVDYVYYPNQENDHRKVPVTTINVNSTIQFPLNRQLLHTGVYKINGIAWTGEGQIITVEISMDGGRTRDLCDLSYPPEKHAWVRWDYTWDAFKKGEYTIKTKATDTKGNRQPAKPLWNRKGYGYNAIDKITVKVE